MVVAGDMIFNTGGERGRKLENGQDRKFSGMPDEGGLVLAEGISMNK